MLATILFIMTISFAYAIKGGVLHLWLKSVPSGKLISTILVALSIGVYNSQLIGYAEYDFPFTLALMSGLAWIVAVAPGLGAYVRALEGMTDQQEELDYIDRLIEPLKDKNLVLWGWAGLTLRGALTGLPFALLFINPAIILICATMPVWYWISYHAHRLIKRKSNEIPWIAEILYGAVIGYAITF
jgi:hypothetical protein